MGFPDSVLEALAAQPEHVAVERGDHAVTGAELLSMIGTIAAGCARAASARAAGWPWTWT